MNRYESHAVDISAAEIGWILGELMILEGMFKLTYWFMAEALELTKKPSIGCKPYMLRYGALVVTYC